MNQRRVNSVKLALWVQIYITKNQAEECTEAETETKSCFWIDQNEVLLAFLHRGLFFSEVF